MSRACSFSASGSSSSSRSRRAHGTRLGHQRREHGPGTARQGHRLAAEGHHAAVHDERPERGLHLLDPVEGEVLDDGADERAHAEALGHDRRDARVDERRRRDRTDRGSRDAAAHGVEQHPVHAELRCGRDESVDGRRRGEGHDVDLARRDRHDETAEAALVGRSHPAVGRDGEHRRPRRPQSLELLDVLVPVQLHGDPLAERPRRRGRA